VGIDSAVPMPMYKSKSYHCACSTVVTEISIGSSNSFMAIEFSLRIISSIGYDDPTIRECVDRVRKLVVRKSNYGGAALNRARPRLWETVTSSAVELMSWNSYKR
jgi:hypothetical protein